MSRLDKNVRTRTFMFMLYPDTESYDTESLVFEIQEYFHSWAYCLHDSDLGDTGQPLKEHLHIVGYRENATTLSAVIKHFKKKGFDISQWIGAWTSHRDAIRYLIHADDKSKHQYLKEQIITNDESIYGFLNIGGEGVLVEELVDLRLAGASYRDLLRYATKNGAYDIFRRNLGIINIIVSEEAYERRKDFMPCYTGERFEE